MYKIAVIPGDGTGPEQVKEGTKVLRAAGERYNFSFHFEHYPLGGEHYLKTGEILPASIPEELKEFDAVYLGAIGHPRVKPGLLEKGLLLQLRFDLDLYINLRPVKLFPGVATPIKDKGPDDINFTVVRENTEGLYSGSGGFLRKNTPDEVAIQESINTRKGVERCIRYAFEYCQKQGRRKVTLCGKTNVLTYAFDLWERAFYEVGESYPAIEKEYRHVDAVCMWMVKNPEDFEVIVTDNMFGDIITDLGAIIQGGMGLAAGGNLHPGRTSMFEPIGGSAPKYAGKNMINPLAAIAAASMMLDFLGEEEASASIERAISEVCQNKLRSINAGSMGYSTSEVGDMVAESIRGHGKTPATPG